MGTYCFICGCKYPQEPKRYPCGCHYELCITCFEHLFQERFECVSDECYKKIVEEDGSIRFEKIKKELYRKIADNFYCKFCFAKWDIDLVETDNYLLGHFDYQDPEQDQKKYIMEKFVFALCKLKKFMEHNSDYKIQKNDKHYLRNYFKDEQNNVLNKKNWYKLTTSWMGLNDIILDMLFDIYIEENPNENIQNRQELLDQIRRYEHLMRSYQQKIQKYVDGLNKILLELSEKSFEEFEKQYESVKDSIELEEMSFIEIRGY